MKRSCLKPLIRHDDLIFVILSYVSSIEFASPRLVGRYGPRDGELAIPWGVSLYGNELLVADRGNNRISAFHQTTGRFLRSWGGYINPSSVVADREYVFVSDEEGIHVSR